MSKKKIPTIKDLVESGMKKEEAKKIVERAKARKKPAKPGYAGDL
jgi:hypothetical protein